MGRRFKRPLTWGGSANNDVGYGGVFASPDGKLIVAGSTNSPDFPGAPAGAGDGFIFKFTPVDRLP